MRYIVIEMQNGVVGEHAWFYETKAEAEVKYYQVLAETVESTVAMHTVMLVDSEGTQIDVKCYPHDVSEES